MRAAIIILSLVLFAPLAHAQREPSLRHQGGGSRAAVELLGGAVGALLAGGLAYGVTLGTLGPERGCEDCNPRPDGFESRLLVTGLSYALFAPPMIAAGVTLFGRATRRHGRFDLALAGAGAGVGGALLFGAFTAAISHGNPGSTRMMLTLTGAVLPVALAVLFYETLSPYPDEPEPSDAQALRVQPLLGVAPDGSGALLGARGAF